MLEVDDVEDDGEGGEVALSEDELEEMKASAQILDAEGEKVSEFIEEYGEELEDRYEGKQVAVVVCDGEARPVAVYDPGDYGRSQVRAAVREEFGDLASDTFKAIGATDSTPKLL